MIDLNKLWQLPPGVKRRKLLLTFGALERDILGIADTYSNYDKKISRNEYILSLTQYLLKDPKLDEFSKEQLKDLLSKMPLNKINTPGDILNNGQSQYNYLLKTLDTKNDLLSRGVQDNYSGNLNNDLNHNTNITQNVTDDKNNCEDKLPNQNNAGTENNYNEQPLKTAIKLISENKVIYSYDSLYSQKVDCFAAIAPRNDENDGFLEMPNNELFNQGITDGKNSKNNYIDTDISLDISHRICNIARNALMKILGVTSSEWDLIIAPHNKTSGERHFHKGIFAYIESLRSPFNLGSIFRTADGLGVEKLFLSPDCVSPHHERAIRSAMGAIDMVDYEIIDIDSLHKKMAGIKIFALETGGCNINDYPFKNSGIVVLGSEELGVNPDTLKKIKLWNSEQFCANNFVNNNSNGNNNSNNNGSGETFDIDLKNNELVNNISPPVVTIPMMGYKESLNVGVAFGILIQNWVTKIS